MQSAAPRHSTQRELGASQYGDLLLQSESALQLPHLSSPASQLLVELALVPTTPVLVQPSNRPSASAPLRSIGVQRRLQTLAQRTLRIALEEGALTLGGLGAAAQVPQRQHRQRLALLSQRAAPELAIA